MRSGKVRILALAAAVCLLMSAFSPAAGVSAKTVKKNSDEYVKIKDDTDWIIFQTIYNQFYGSEEYITGKTSYKLTKEDYKTILLSYMIDGNIEYYTKSEIKALSKKLFGKSYVDSDFLSYFEKKGKKYIVMLGDYGQIDFKTDNLTISKKKGYIYVSGDYYADDYEGNLEDIGKLTFKFEQVGDDYALKGAKFTPAN